MITRVVVPSGVPPLDPHPATTTQTAKIAATMPRAKAGRVRRFRVKHKAKAAPMTASATSASGFCQGLREWLRGEGGRAPCVVMVTVEVTTSSPSSPKLEGEIPQVVSAGAPVQVSLML